MTQPIVKKRLLEVIRDLQPATLLDAPSGDGWLPDGLDFPCQVDGVDLYRSGEDRYRNFYPFDLNEGLPHGLPLYDLILSCEGLEHLGAPLRFLKAAFSRLRPGGRLMVTTPNVWYASARVKYLLRGFFPSFPPAAADVSPGEHLHLIPWTWPQLHLFLNLCGFRAAYVEHLDDLSRPKSVWERFLAWPQIRYCRQRLQAARTDREKAFWETALRDEVLHGRHLLVVAQRP